MTPGDDDLPGEGRATGKPPVIPFPFSRSAPRSAGGSRDLGLGRLAQLLGIPGEQTSGHWCSRCEGIWFGYLLEVTCPACGSRQG